MLYVAEAMIICDEHDDRNDSWDEVNDLSSLFTNTDYTRRIFEVPCGDEDEIDFPASDKVRHPRCLTVDLHCSLAASTDYDLTGQIVWPVSSEFCD